LKTFGDCELDDDASEHTLQPVLHCAAGYFLLFRLNFLLEKMICVWIVNRHHMVEIRLDIQSAGGTYLSMPAFKFTNVAL
jgi:hypothetical protein